ncbi:PD-(D/E)XK motif protein [Aeromicrobium sp.]|uniref:PD-(D/E)XK motif protein n=1 Tax=Aeromicrobium sp. TaxID=1871063 RepID=UPI001986653D|nr:PD-(D/E)XK motif protein [Aeromicrobium sp.]MBC7632574.1 PD-(D/E)XK motif protein [Aeromicrobium sp.]
MIDLGAVWASMDTDATGAGKGEVQRRLRGTPFDLFLTQERPSRRAGFFARFDERPGTLWRELRSSQGLDIRVDARPGVPATLQLTEVDDRFHSIFEALVTDLLKGLEILDKQPVDRRAPALDFLAGRVIRWQTCLKANSDGMSGEKRAGLFGEPSAAAGLLEAGVDAKVCMDRWTGPAEAIQDFQFDALTIEVKASRQTQPTTVRISSERQLDTSGLDRLLLVHVALDERSDGTGQTLPAKVAELRDAVGRQSDAGLLLDDRLIQYGYLDMHAPRYEDRSYAIRAVEHFDVREPMARIVEADLPVGVGDVTYGLALSACEDFRLDEAEVAALLEGLRP